MAKQKVFGLEKLRELLPESLNPPYPLKEAKQDPYHEAIESSYARCPLQQPIVIPETIEDGLIIDKATYEKHKDKIIRLW